MNREERRRRAKNDPRMSGAEIRYGGRTIQITAYVNTDEDELEVLQRVQEAAKGPGKRMVLVAGGLLPEDQWKLAWETIIGAAADAVDREPSA